MTFFTDTKNLGILFLIVTMIIVVIFSHGFLKEQDMRVKILFLGVFAYVFGFLTSYLEDISEQYRLLFYSLGIFVIFISIPYFGIQHYYVSIVAIVIGSAYWFYSFYQQYQEERMIGDVTNLTFICSPNGVCDNDQFSGVLHADKETYNYKNNEYGYVPRKVLHVKLKHVATYTLWIRPKTYNMETQYILSKEANGYEKPVIMIPKSTEVPQLQFIVNQEIFTHDIDYDYWTYIGLVFFNNQVELYINGYLEKTKILQEKYSEIKGDLYIGRKKTDNGNMYRFMGDICLVRYVNKNLSPKQIKDDFEKGVQIIKGIREVHLGKSSENAVTCPTLTKKIKGEVEKEVQSMKDRGSHFMKDIQGEREHVEKSLEDEFSSLRGSHFMKDIQGEREHVEKSLEDEFSSLTSSSSKQKRKEKKIPHEILIPEIEQSFSKF